MKITSVLLFREQERSAFESWVFLYWGCAGMNGPVQKRTRLINHTGGGIIHWKRSTEF